MLYVVGRIDPSPTTAARQDRKNALKRPELLIVSTML
jgi:hypothetical protein